MRKKLLMIFLLFLCLFHHWAYAEQSTTDVTLQVEGRAPVVKDDEARARNEAVKNALEKALMQASANILSNKIEDEKLQAMKSIMVGKVDRYIKNYRIISENRQQDEYAANVHVVVASAPLTDDLVKMGVLQDHRGKEGAAVSLSIKGMTRYSDFVHLKTFLQNRSKIIKSVYPCCLEWQRAKCDLVLAGEVKNLVAELEQSGKYTLDSVNQNQKIVEINMQVR